MHVHQRIGAIRVSRVSVDLQERGIEVFREDGLCSFDMVAHKNGSLVRIEIKGTSKHLDSKRYDILARVVNGSVRYTPSLRAYKRHQNTPNPLLKELIGNWKPSKMTTKKNLEAAYD
jgi:hypothetical protein